MIAVLLVFACVSCTNRQNEEHTVDATYEASKEEMRKVYEEYEGKELLIGLWKVPKTCNENPGGCGCQICRDKGSRHQHGLCICRAWMMTAARKPLKLLKRTISG